MTREMLTRRILVTATLLLAGQLAVAEPLGRLFLTPERRAQLERQRELNIQEAQTLDGAVVSLDGVVTRSSGKSTVWVNQQAQNENSAGSGVAVVVSRSQPGQAIVAAGDEPAASLKVGESINRTTRQRDDGLAGGRIAVTRKP